MAYLHDLDWLFAIGVIFFCASIWGIGANDVANSYATSVSSRSLTLVDAACLVTMTEFVRAIALGQGVTDTVRSGVFSIDNFTAGGGSPGGLLMAMVIAEIGSATSLIVCTRLGFPVSTTQSIVGALVGVGTALNIGVKWDWQSGSVSQIAASWFIAPTIAAGFGAILMLSIRVLVHSRSNPLKAVLYALPFYYGLTAAILALFITISGGHGIPTPAELGAGKAVGIVLGVFAGVWLISALFFLAYFHRKLVKEDRRLRIWHIPMGPMLWQDDPKLYWPGNENASVVPNYYATEYIPKGSPYSSTSNLREKCNELGTHVEAGRNSILGRRTLADPKDDAPVSHDDMQYQQTDAAIGKARQSDLQAVDHLAWTHPRRIWATVRLLLTYGITRDIFGHQFRGLEEIHKRTPVFDNKVEHLWTTAQIYSAMIMSIAHGANDVSNAIGPFTTEFQTWRTSTASAESATPLWIKAVGGLGLGIGFWTFGYHIMRNLRNRITKHSPTRGFCMELAAAITVLLATQLKLPVSTTRCITGGIIGVALVNFDLKSINWKQLGKIFIGWVLTVPCAGLISGIILGMAINTPNWAAGQRPERGVKPHIVPI